MLSPRNNRFGIPGVISVIALVFAMFGGAYAATNEGGKATSSAKAKKGPRGPKGPKGDTGPAGPAGPAGAQGPAGPAGPQGPKGDRGDTGAQGKEGPQGKEGKAGKSGFTETLPAGKTETGTWSFGPGPASFHRIPISFTIPIAAALASTSVHYINKAGEEVPGAGPPVPPTKCDGDAANPTADPGHLCVYTGDEESLLASNEFIFQADGLTLGASKVGAILQFASLDGFGGGAGSWAVTAEEE